MKTKLFTLLVLIAMTISAQAADAITGLKLTIKQNGGSSVVQTIPANGFADVDISNATTNSLIIEKIEVETSGVVKNVSFNATMYTTQSGPDKNDEWRSIPLTSQGNGVWGVEMGDAGELVDLQDGKQKTFEFFVKGYNASDGEILYNNGGANYKVIFTRGQGDTSNWTIKFYYGETASLSLKVNGATKDYMYNGNAVRTKFYGEQPGDVNSLIIDGFGVMFIYNKDKGVEIDNVALQYRINEDGVEGQWKSLTSSLTDSRQHYNEEYGWWEYGVIYTAEDLNVEITSGLTVGKNYELELAYQVKSVSGEYKMLKGSDMCFAFRVTNTDDIKSVQVGQSTTSPRFNLSGQRVDKTYKGVIIAGGKKVLVK